MAFILPSRLCSRIETLHEKNFHLSLCFHRVKLNQNSYREGNTGHIFSGTFFTVYSQTRSHLLFFCTLRDAFESNNKPYVSVLGSERPQYTESLNINKVTIVRT